MLVFLAPEWRSSLRHCISVLRHHYSLRFDPKLCHNRQAGSHTDRGDRTWELSG
jgi:hypothetical protein